MHTNTLPASYPMQNFLTKKEMAKVLSRFNFYLTPQILWACMDKTPEGKND